MTILGAEVNVLAFVGNNYAVSKNGLADAEAKLKGYDLAEASLQVNGKWNEGTMKQLDVINKTLSQKNESKASINSVHEVIHD